MLPSPAPGPAPGTHRRRLLIGLGLGLVFVGLPIVLLEYADRTPLRGFALATLFFLWGCFCLALAVWSRRRRGRGALAFNVGIALLALGVIEIHAGRQLVRPLRYTRRPPPSTYTRKDALLGYMPVPGSASRFTAMAGDEVASDVTYTIDGHGHRIQPPRKEPPAHASILCFGCSITYGSGVEDDETWPWRLEVELGGRLRVYNFAFSGYGPQQMLAALEGGRVAGTIEEPPRHAVFVTFYDHMRRVTGKGGFALHEPRYVLRDDGRVERAGLFGDDAANAWKSSVRQLVNHSNTIRLLTEATRPEQYDRELFVAVIAAARERIQEAWPDCAFHVLLWPIARPVDATMRTALEERGLEVWMTSDLIPGLADDPAAFRVHRHDAHPNARATQALAEALATRFAPHD